MGGPAPSRPACDLSAYLVTDQRLCGERSLTDVVGLAVRGGVGVVQLREKRLGFREMLDLGLALKALLAPFDVPLLINDRVDVAQAVGAAGAHLGQSDMPVALARQLLGPQAILGVSTLASIMLHGRITRTGSPEEIAGELSAAYLGASTTPSHV